MKERTGEIRRYGRPSRRPHQPGPVTKSCPVRWGKAIEVPLGQRRDLGSWGDNRFDLVVTPNVIGSSLGGISKTVTTEFDPKEDL